MNKLLIIICFLLSLTGCVQAPQSIQTKTPQIKEYSVSSHETWQEVGLSPEEIKFLTQLQKEVQADNQHIDYNEYLTNPPTNNKGQFWYQCAVVLSTLPENQQLDIRPNGKLFRALGILDEMLKYNSKFPQIWAQKIIVLNYLAHGYWSSASALNMVQGQEEKAEEHRHATVSLGRALLETAEEAAKMYPEDEWFQDELEHIRENFGSFAEKQ